MTSASSSLFPGNFILISSKACSVRRLSSSSLSRTTASKKAASLGKEIIIYNKRMSVSLAAVKSGSEIGRGNLKFWFEIRIS